MHAPGNDDRKILSMKMRSLLFVPADSEAKIAKSRSVDADVLIFDLEDSASGGRKEIARKFVRDHLESLDRQTCGQIYVRINPLSLDVATADLLAIVGGVPDGIMLPKANGIEDIEELGRRLDQLENENGIAAGSIKIIPVATETPAAHFNLGGLSKSHPRLAGLTWGAEDLSAAVGASAYKETDGSWTSPYQLARSLALFAAAACGVDAIDTLHADFRDEEGLFAAAVRARRDGFSGMLAIHPSQVPIINAAFTPSPEVIAHAYAVTDAFKCSPEAGVVSLNGKMPDRPHFVQANKILARR